MRCAVCECVWGLKLCMECEVSMWGVSSVYVHVWSMCMECELVCAYVWV